MNGASGNVLFAKSNSKVFESSEETIKTYSLLKNALETQGFGVEFSSSGENELSLADIDILVAGIPEYLKGTLDPAQVESFLTGGGSVLLLTNAFTMMNPPPSIHQVTEIAGVRFKEYLNAPASTVTRLFPHWITANVKKLELEPDGIATLSLVSDSATILAETDPPSEPFIVCASVGKGRVVFIGNAAWLRNDQIKRADHFTLLKNIFSWLARKNSLEIEKFYIPNQVNIEQADNVIVSIRNQDPENRISFKCMLDSDAGAIIDHSVREKHGLPYNQVAEIRWQLVPQKLGEQRLRFLIEPENGATLYFDYLPELVGVADGYLTLEVKNHEGSPQTRFRTGEHFIVEGTFHSTSPINFPLLDSLDLELGAGLIQRAFEPGSYKSRWYIQAAKAGCHEIRLSLKDTKQSLCAQVQIQPSVHEKIQEIVTAIKLPLNAEIAARLQQIDQSLGSEVVQNIPFKILTTDEFINALYQGESAARLEGMLLSARREQWFNPNLLKIMLTYFLPTYVPNRGVFIPFDPDLASNLGKLHPRDRRYLENNLLCSNESSIVLTKQITAAYLLHERYGHGFFYKQTRLGRQLELLYFDDKYKALIKVIDDSSTIVNEGFATWLELHFLDKLGQEIRPIVSSRRDLLIERSSGMFELALNSNYFQVHPPLYDSPYREGFEYFEFISTTFQPRCAVQLMKLANDIDLGIVEENSVIVLKKPEEEIIENLLDLERNSSKSNLRLRKMAEHLRSNKAAMADKTKKKYCPFDCIETGCPLVEAIEDKFQWRLLI
ncbi:MAG: hypothetical protein CL609_07465 [Anaerolineaceae bacterium]|nr:hypothetical protein [Anaerolineaceae bacterium]